MEGFSKDGRKLRPRKSASTQGARSERVDYSSDSRQKSYGEHRSFDGERRPYGENRPHDGERRSYGEHRSFEGHRSHEGGRPFGEHKTYGEHRPYGERKQYGDHKPYGERRNFSENGNNGEGRQYGERRSFEGNRSNEGGRPFGERRSFGDRKPYGERRSFNGSRDGGEGRQFGEHRNFGDRKPGFKGGKPGFRKNAAPHFGKDTEDGINRMISRRPLVTGAEYSDADTVETPIQNEIRLNKFIANSGVCSRREADTLIQAGVVTVNGEVITELGTKVNVFEDDIRFNGERLKGEEKVYLVMNKPKGFVTTASDPHAEKTVLDLLKGCSARVYPVGRLDKATTGVLMFTNDGEIAERLTHPSYDKKKIYQVALDRELSQEDHDRILEGVTLNDGDVKADTLEYIDENDKRKLGIEIHSGKNRIVRRIFESLGYNVKALDRVYFAGLTKKGLKKGEWRYLTEAEVNILKMGAYV